MVPVEIITPIDIEIDQDLDVSRPAVRRAIREVLPRVATIAGAMSCYQVPGPRKAPWTSSIVV